MGNELTTVEQSELDQYEEIIEQGFKTFLEVGQALAVIRDKRLYRAKFATFEDYCTVRWKFTRQRAYQLMSAAQVAIGLSTTVDIPNEAIARQFARLENPEHQRAAALMAIATAPDGKITADWVESTIDVMTDIEATGGFVNIGTQWTAIQAGITNEQHQKMIEKQKQISAGKQHPVAIGAMPAAELLDLLGITWNERVAGHEMLRIVVYRATPADNSTGQP